MPTTRHRRAAAALALSAALAATSGCSWWFGRTDPGRQPRPLAARNHGHLDVTVHAVPADGRAGRRLGTVRGFATATLALRPGDLRPGGLLVVRVRAARAATSWDSPAVAVGADRAPRLDVHMDSRGALGRSTLVPGPARVAVR